jgi:hypothetical protein
MKTTHSLLTIAAAALLSATSFAQAINCDLFTITSIEPDSINANNTIINIQMAGNSNDFINYPVIPTVWDCDDNVVSSGTLFFFGQFGQTTQGYPVNTLNDNICFPITVQFVYGDEQLVNDTCLLTFIPLPQSVQNIIEDDFTVFPNPTTGEVQLNIPDQLIGNKYTLLDATGRVVLTDKIRSASTTLSLESLPAGVYMLHAGESVGYTRRIVKH